MVSLRRRGADLRPGVAVREEGEAAGDVDRGQDAGVRGEQEDGGLHRVVPLPDGARRHLHPRRTTAIFVLQSAVLNFGDNF